jgi:MFS family permease
VQGVGGADDLRGDPGHDRHDVPRPREQAKAIGVYAFAFPAGGSIGLLAGGVLTQALNWHWIFFVNLPIGLVTAVLARRLLEPDRGSAGAEGADHPPGAVDHERADARGLHDRQARGRLRLGARAARWGLAPPRWPCS